MPFRSTFQYSNVNYAAAGYVIEFLTGRDFYEVMTERIINKLDLEGTYDLSEALASGNASNGFMHMDVNTTQCAIDTATLAEEGGSSVAGMRPPSCIGRVEGYESWSKGKRGHDYGGGGGVNLNGRGLVSNCERHRSIANVHYSSNGPEQLPLPKVSLKPLSIPSKPRDLRPTTSLPTRWDA